MNTNRNTINVDSIVGCRPTKAHPADAAYDLFTAKEVEITPNSRTYVPLGFRIQLPEDIGLVIQPRSGQSGKGMIAVAQAPKWLGGDRYQIRINADSIVGLVDSGYDGQVMAIVKVGRLRLKHRILRMLGFNMYIETHSRICQGRLVYIPAAMLVDGCVRGFRRGGLGSTDKI